VNLGELLRRADEELRSIRETLDRSAGSTASATRVWRRAGYNGVQQHPEPVVLEGAQALVLIPVIPYTQSGVFGRGRRRPRSGRRLGAYPLAHLLRGA
jgi:hypothetical protein